MAEKDLKNIEQTTEKKRRKKTGNKMPLSKKLMILAAVLLVISLGIGFYPNIAKFFTGIQQSNRISEFDKNIEKVKEDAKTEGVKFPSDPDGASDNEYKDYPLMDKEQVSLNEEQTRQYDPKLLAKLYADMVKYNKDLYENGQIISDPFSYEEESFDLKKYSIYDDIFGYVSAPKIGLNLPIYLGASEDNMWRGAVQLTGTSMPIGGVNTNTVLAAHRGVVNFVMFDNIVFLEKGDSVFVTNPWYQMEYKVVKTEIILPSESDKIKIQPGKDMLTLFTCHPYGYMGYRYLVYCERV